MVDIIHIILVSHGDFAKGLKTSLAMFVGDKIDQIIAVGLKNGESADQFAEDLQLPLAEISSDDSLIVLADIIGGSPLTTLCSALSKMGKLDETTILGGVNLPMALNAVLLKDNLKGEDFIKTVLGEAQSSLREFKVTANDEDDDI